MQRGVFFFTLPEERACETRRNVQASAQFFGLEPPVSPYLNGEDFSPSARSRERLRQRSLAVGSVLILYST